MDVRTHEADGTAPPPGWLVMVVNNFCNLKCRMCDVGLGEQASVFHHHLIGDAPRNMSLELFETVLEQAADFDPPPRIGLAYTEPLIHAGVLDLCRAAVERQFFVSITTNGFMLPRLADDLVAIGVDEIVVSVDGPEAVHDRIRGRTGSFARLREGVERLKRARDGHGSDRPRVGFSYTITDLNTTAMSDFARAVAPLEPDSLVFSHLNFISDGLAEAHNARWGDRYPVARSNVGTMDVGGIDLDALWDGLAELKEVAAATPGLPAPQIVPDLTSRELLETYYRDPETFVGGRRCTDPWKLAMIRSDGTVVPAHGRCYDVPAGKVTERPLTELWNDARLRAFRRDLMEAGGTLPACSRCCGVIGKAVASPR